MRIKIGPDGRAEIYDTDLAKAAAPARRRVPGRDDPAVRAAVKAQQYEQLAKTIVSPIDAEAYRELAKQARREAGLTA